VLWQGAEATINVPPIKRRLAWLPILAALVAGSFGIAPAQAATQRIDVQIPQDGLWTAHLVGFDISAIRSVTYYWRDAADIWRHTQPEFIPPYSAAVAWWEGDNNGYEAVTAHVSLHSGPEIVDPGGWHWVDGHHVDPRGTLAAYAAAGHYSAAYTPQSEAGQIGGVEFWLKDQSGDWHDAGPGQQALDGDWASSLLLEADGKAFTAKADAIAVHVVWPNGTQWSDPAPWATVFTSPAQGTPAAPLPPGLPTIPLGSVAEPNRAVTPGAVTAGVTAAQVCTAGWASAHRHVTHDQYVTVYSTYGIAYPEASGSYELDHLIPLELGGSNDNINLWPQPASPAPGFHQKDALENSLRSLVCSGQLNLGTAQQAIAADWYLAYLKYLAPTRAPAQPAAQPTSVPVQATAAPITYPTSAPAPIVQAPPADAMAALRAQGISAICNDGTYSKSTTRSGTCSQHHGVQTWTGLI
jgi:hypothetical protein